MQWSNNPEAVAVFHRQVIEDLVGERKLRTLIRQLRSTGPDTRH